MTTVLSHSAVGDPAAIARLDRFGGPDLVHRLSTLFLAEVPRRIAAARAALELGNLPAVKAVAHALKSSCGQMGAVAMNELAVQIERSGDPQAVACWLGELQTEFERYAVWLRYLAENKEIS